MREVLKISKTYELRKVITKLLKEANEKVFYENATDKTPYPYIVYEFDTVTFENINRDDVILTIDIWDKGKDSEKVEKIADKIEDLLNFKNNPTGKVLPTFYLASRNSIRDEDKNIRRRELRFLIQNYYIGG